METIEKLNIFYSSTIDAASKLSSDEMREFSISLEKMFEKFKQEQKEEFESRYQIEKEKAERDVNRRVSEALMEQKRKLSRHQQEKKQALFQAVERRLEQYRKTEEYKDWLISKIRLAKEFAREEEIEIYLDPKDADKKAYLEQETGCSLKVSEHGFKGGIRAAVRSRNILIDESFQSKINQEQEAYTF